jgi:glycosyltransferase involved in cell wall biosynthesis
MVLLIGNYAPDRQHSMLRFAAMMLEGLQAAGVPAELIQPEPIFGKLRFAGGFVAKWLSYIDKFLLFPLRLKKKLAEAPALVHICDHSNAMYAREVETSPVLVTCHDLLAVRGALGEGTDTPASATGKFLQRWILAGLGRATAIACDSEATRRDAERLVRRTGTAPQLEVITLGLSYPFRQLPPEEVRQRLASVPALSGPYVLHVGSNLRRKNREAILRIFAKCQAKWRGQLVFAGDLLSDELRSAGQQLGIGDRVVEVPQPGNELLEALYNGATALLYPSRFEGFGWPIIEAQACGCPVICTAAPPMSEIAGDGALVHDVEDEAGFADSLLRLTNPEERTRWSEKALANAQRFTTERMIADYTSLYRSLAPV